MFTVYADAQFYKDVWFKFRQWFQDYRDIPGFQGSHGNMPITPRQVEEGVKKGGNALGLQEGPQDKTLGSELLISPSLQFISSSRNYRNANSRIQSYTLA